MQIRVGGRSRTLSQPAKPSSPAGRPRVDSLTSPTPRERPVSSLSHHRPSSSLSHNQTPSRSSSSASSTTPDSATELQHLRERNWNATHPNWSLHNGWHSHVHHQSQEESPRSLAVNGHKRRDPSPNSSASGNERMEDSSSKANDVQVNSNAREETLRHSNVSRHPSSSSLRPRASLRDRPQPPSLSSKQSKSTAQATPIVSPRLPSRAKTSSHDRIPINQGSGKSTSGGLSSVHKHKQTDKAVFVSHIPVRSKDAVEPSSTSDSQYEENEQPVASAATEAVVSKISVSVDSAALHESDWETNDGTQNAHCGSLQD